MENEFKNFTKEQVYKVGRMDALNQINKKFKRAKEIKALRIVESMIKKEKKKMDFITWALNEGFYDI